ncbi:MAG: ferredoxin [Ilumatobacteraceae bacterium]
MKVIVDIEMCQGHGRCNALAPEVFPLDEVGYCAITEAEVPVELESAAHIGAGACPERAITIVD